MVERQWDRLLYSLLMRLRRFLTRTRAGKICSILLLATFVLLCGFHIVGNYHRSDPDSFALAADALVLLVLAGVAIVLGLSRAWPRRLIAPPLSLAAGAMPPAWSGRDLVRAEAPLLC